MYIIKEVCFLFDILSAIGLNILYTRIVIGIHLVHNGLYVIYIYIYVVSVITNWTKIIVWEDF
jgi:hypothetical protein